MLQESDPRNPTRKLSDLIDIFESREQQEREAIVELNTLRMNPSMNLEVPTLGLTGRCWAS
jgi:hypothetical protein